jgi:hypothetical protein
MKVEYNEDGNILLVPENDSDRYALSQLLNDEWHLISDTPEYFVSGVRKFVKNVELKMVPLGEIYF